MSQNKFLRSIHERPKVFYQESDLPLAHAPEVIQPLPAPLVKGKRRTIPSCVGREESERVQTTAMSMAKHFDTLRSLHRQVKSSVNTYESLMTVTRNLSWVMCLVGCLTFVTWMGIPSYIECMYTSSGLYVFVSSIPCWRTKWAIECFPVNIHSLQFFLIQKKRFLKDMHHQ